jgi:hypothetical protein
VAGLEINTHGLTDVRLSHSKTNQSYLDAGYGKFSSNNGISASIAQLGLNTNISFNSQLSARMVLNGYSLADGINAGVSEAYIKYKTLPFSNGWRLESRAGFFYPKISLENEAFAWASVNTLNSSMLNTWIAEEIRLTGTEVKLTHLGKISNKPYDFSITGTVFVNNDPSGALLAWHGWTTSSRQSLWGEAQSFSLPLAAQGSGPLAAQARRSKPFTDIDDHLGYQVQFDIDHHDFGQFNAGIYNNSATPFLISDGQYGWATHFSYAGVKLKFANQLQLTAQHLQGSTLMQSPSLIDMVNNDYSTRFIMLSKRHNKHRYALRLEEFEVIDNDSAVGDNNTEDGKALTVNYTYRYSKPLFLSGEFNVVESHRPSRVYQNIKTSLTENQIQFALRYFF